MRTVRVADTTAPQMNVVAASPLLLPGSHQYIAFAIASLVTSATDTCDAGVGVDSVVITQLTSDEADNGNGDGNTFNDIVIAANCRSVQLRAERAGPNNGRVYTVALRVKDAAGNTTNRSVKLLVPATDTGTAAVDDGPMTTVNSACQ